MKASHLRGFLLVGAPGLEPGTSSPPGLYSVLAGDDPTWREVAWFLGKATLAWQSHRSLRALVFRRLGTD
jgi:hypothetical protein